MLSQQPLPGPRVPALRRAGIQAAGLALFLFIPLVLFLFVRHPRPVAASLAAGLALMLGHRLLARPYMERVLPIKCVWCNRVVPAALDSSTRTLDLAAGGTIQPARCCAAHLAPAARFFALLAAARWVLRGGIFIPLALLLAALAAAGLGWPAALPAATALFQLAVGFTVLAASLAYPAMPGPASRAAIAVPFPVHNFFLLGVRNLLWIFRLVGLWWVYAGIGYWLGK